MSNIQDRYFNLKTTGIKILSVIENTQKTIDDMNVQYETLTNEHAELVKTASVLSDSITVMKECLDRASREQIDRIAGLLTYAFKTIFTDREYEVEVLVNDKHNAKTCELWLKETKDCGVVRSPFDDGIGGGILAVAGFVLQVYYLGIMKQSPIIFMDESFSQISSQYIPALMGFIDELASKKNFIFVLISHDVRLMPYANKKYIVSMGNVTEGAE